MVTFFGVIYLVFTVAMLAMLFGKPEYGFWNISGYAPLVGMYAFCVIFYYYYKWKRKKEGIDLSMVYKEIPVE